jgi:hypothetical protein
MLVDDRWRNQTPRHLAKARRIPSTLSLVQPMTREKMGELIRTPMQLLSFLARSLGRSETPFSRSRHHRATRSDPILRRPHPPIARLTVLRPKIDFSAGSSNWLQADGRFGPQPPLRLSKPQLIRPDLMSRQDSRATHLLAGV